MNSVRVDDWTAQLAIKLMLSSLLFFFPNENITLYAALLLFLMQLHSEVKLKKLDLFHIEPLRLSIYLRD